MMYKFISLIFLWKNFSAIDLHRDSLSLSNSWWEAAGCISNIRSLSSSKRRFCSERSSTKAPQQSASSPSSGSGTEGHTSFYHDVSPEGLLSFVEYLRFVLLQRVTLLPIRLCRYDCENVLLTRRYNLNQLYSLWHLVHVCFIATLLIWVLVFD